MTRVKVLRLGHRTDRDRRISTHIGLVARAFGAEELIFSNQGIKDVKKSIESVNEKWGGSLKIRETNSWKNEIKNWQSKGGKVIHLTMYGLSINEKIQDIKNEDILIIVGASKVPKEAYNLADFNIAVGNQPHSEVAALAVFLDRVFEGSELEKNFSGAKIRVLPTESGKKIKKIDD
ncbi:MAG: tRNA (cytidine(56)-2'-O)-methyltransferase [Hadesarchaea archaeon]|nr:tRNA (cytidine(56)-2'-O)-methyltransferase [Hadesarchaea archaeon]